MLRNKRFSIILILVAVICIVIVTIAVSLKLLDKKEKLSWDSDTTIRSTPGMYVRISMAVVPLDATQLNILIISIILVGSNYFHGEKSERNLLSFLISIGAI